MMDFYKKYEKIINCFITLFSLSFVMYAFYIAYPQHIKVICLTVILYLCVIGFYLFYDQVKKIISYLIKYRYVFALIVFIFCLIFRVHGSSIDTYNNLFPMEKQDKTTTILFGKNREIRSDEFMVHTPYYFSQHYNDYKKINKRMSLGGQDMIVGYNSPVKDISIIAKPLTWGYILFGNEIGLSWYWCLKLILLILAGYEISMIVTKNNKKVSLIGAFLISFAPALQWWFVPHATDVFLWGMWLCILGYYFFITNKKWLKNLITIIAPLVLSIFVLALFPSGQVGVGLVVLSIFIAALCRDKKDINFKKVDIVRIVIIILIISVVLGYSLYTSLDALKILNNTVYPGHRVTLGGGFNLSKIFTDLTTIFLPYKDSNILNNCEVSDFIHFTFPFLIVFPFLVKGLRKEKDRNLIIGMVLVVALVIELVFMIVGFPRFLAKITLFSYINRMGLIYGFTGVLFTLWTISMVWKYPKILSNKIKFISVILFVISMFFIISENNLKYLSIYYFVLEIMLFGIIVCLIYIKKEVLTICFISLMLLFSSATINPVASGIVSVSNHKLVKEVKKLYKKDDGYFLVTNSTILQNLLLANGAKVINAVNFYPDLKKWYLLDKNKKHEDIYNRYAHLNVSLTNNKTKYRLFADDSIILNLNVKDLKKWSVKYVVSNGKIDNVFNKENIKYKRKKADNYFIYILS